MPAATSTTTGIQLGVQPGVPPQQVYHQVYHHPYHAPFLSVARDGLGSSRLGSTSAALQVQPCTSRAQGLGAATTPVPSQPRTAPTPCLWLRAVAPAACKCSGEPSAASKHISGSRAAGGRRSALCALPGCFAPAFLLCGGKQGGLGWIKGCHPDHRYFSEH